MPESNDHQHLVSGEKKAYHPPRMEALGPVSDLVNAGSGNFYDYAAGYTTEYSGYS